MVLDEGAVVREMAARLAERVRQDETPIFVRERATLPAHLAALDGRWADACTLYAAALEDEGGIDLYGQAIETRLLLAHALVTQRRPADAAAALRPMLQRVAASGEEG